MNFDMAMNYIEEKNKLGIVPGLDNIKELLRRLGNPQNQLKCLHIAGTNGKGSIFAFVEQGLLQAGYKVGRYISPTIFTYLERFQINKINMTEEEFARILTAVAEQVEAMVADGFESPTAFEIETAVGFAYFLEEQVDFVLVECGMGGRLDGTNVIDCPTATVIAQISMDHMQFLGDTLEKIAEEKAGIIHPGTICISAPQEKVVSDVLKKRCQEFGVPYLEVNPAFLSVEKMDLSGTQFSIGNNKSQENIFNQSESYHIQLLGDHQVLNAATAVLTLRELGIDEENIGAGLAETCWEGRLTKVGEKPYIFVDGAHNEAAWEYLSLAVKKYFTNRRIIYIIGVLKDKEYEKMLKLLTPSMSYAVTVTPNTPRGLAKEKLAQLIEGYEVPVTTADTAEAALRLARERASENDVILVCGSLSFISDYLI